jgi:glycosyltransferase involved in cell wall biosynthesis
VSGVLVVTEAPRSAGGYRRGWVRNLYERYVPRYRRLVTRACARAGQSDVTLLAGRALVDEHALPSHVVCRYYDEETIRGDDSLAKRTREVFESWWPARDAEPDLMVEGIWLPDVMSVGKALLIRLEVMEYVSIVERVLNDAKPDRIVLVTGASIVERVARALAIERGIPIRVGAWFPPAKILALAERRLRYREEHRALDQLLNHRRHPVAPSPTRYLFSVSHARHFMMVNPLAQALRARGFECRVVGSTRENVQLEAPLRRLEREAGVPGTYFMDYLPRRDAIRLAGRLGAVRRRLGRAPAGATSPLDRVLARYRRHARIWTLATARLYLAAAFRMLDTHRPTAVVITSDRRMSEQALARAARARGIPTLLYWGGAILGRDRIDLFDGADRLLVFGEHIRKALAQRGIDESRVVVMGDPRADAARRVPPRELRSRVVADLGLAADRPIVVLVSKYESFIFSATEKDALYRSARDAMRALDGVNVVVKAHPNEDTAALAQRLAALGWPEAVVTQTYDIHRLFRAADLALMVTSMAGIEAMDHGCPVVAIQPAGKNFEGNGMPRYVTDGAVELVAADDVDGLARAVRHLLTDPAAHAALAARGRAFAAQYVRPVDGALADRIDAEVTALREGRPR